MKKIAFFLFLLFAVAQIAPAVKAIVSVSTSVFIADEEKVDNNNKRDKQELAVFSSPSFTPRSCVSMALMLSENIHPSPLLEKLSPPPNFC